MPTNPAGLINKFGILNKYGCPYSFINPPERTNLARNRADCYPASYFIWIPLEQEVRADAIAMARMRERISVTTALPFSTSPNVPHAIRLAIGSVDLTTLKRSLETVASVVAKYTY